MKKIIFVAFLAFISSGCSSNLAGETQGYIKTVVIDREAKASKRKTSSNKRKKQTTTSVETEIEYSYNVQGRNYEGFSEKDGDVQQDFPVGATLVVCYNLSNPEESDIFASGTKCGS